MSDSYIVSRRTLYILIASAAILSILLVMLGFVLGRNVSIPEPFPSVDQLAGDVSTVTSEDELPEEIRTLRKSGGGETSGTPFVDNEKLSFFEKLKIDDEPEKDADASESETEPRAQQSETASEETTVVTSALPTPVPTATPDRMALAGSDFKKAYVVQVHSVKNKAWAEKARRDLERSGYPAYISRVRFKTGIVNYRVRVGPYLDRQAAETIKEQIRREFHQSPLVMTVVDGQK